MSHLKQSCNEDRWEKAQKMELKEWKEFAGFDDWNLWWKKKFNNYSFMADKTPKSIVEVGCGPFARNISYVLKSINTNPTRIILNDPLIKDYLKLNKRVKQLHEIEKYEIVSNPLETLNLEYPVDCIICINVLDHVFDAAKCFESMYNNLNVGGILILGQDLSNEDDGRKLPESDIMHPIRFDEAYANKYLIKYQKLFRKVLPRKDGRNPPYHYATMLFAGIK